MRDCLPPSHCLGPTLSVRNDQTQSSPRRPLWDDVWTRDVEPTYVGVEWRRVVRPLCVLSRPEGPTGFTSQCRQSPGGPLSPRRGPRSFVDRGSWVLVVHVDPDIGRGAYTFYCRVLKVSIVLFCFCIGQHGLRNLSCASTIVSNERSWSRTVYVSNT